MNPYKSNEDVKFGLFHGIPYAISIVPGSGAIMLYGLRKRLEKKIIFININAKTLNLTKWSTV